MIGRQCKINDQDFKIQREILMFLAIVAQRYKSGKVIGRPGARIYLEANTKLRNKQLKWFRPIRFIFVER